MTRPPLLSFNARFWRWPLRVLALGFALLFLGFWAPQTLLRTDTERDVVIYYRAARHVLAGQSPYVARPDYSPLSKPFDYLYPPPFAALTAPLGRLSFVVFARLWTLFLLACWWGFAAILARLAGAKIGLWSLLGASLAMGLTPGGLRAFALGQIDPFLWLLGGLATLGALRQNAGAGGALSAASLLKIYGFWPLLAFFDAPRRRAVWACAALVGALGIALGGAVCGFGAYATWARAVLPVAGQGTFDPDNVSLSMAVLRLTRLTLWHYDGAPLHGIARAWLSFAALAGPLGMLWLTRRQPLVWRVALVSVAAAWCAPLCWSNYVPIALVPLALWFGQATVGTQSGDSLSKPR